MIKKSHRKYLILLLVIELLFMTSSIIQYLINRSGGETIELPAENFFALSGDVIDGSYYIDASYYADESAIVNSYTFTYGPYVKVGKGSYDVTVYYETDTNANYCYVHSNTLTDSEIKSAYRIPMPKEKSNVTFSILLTQEVEDLEIITEFCRVGSLRIEKIILAENTDYYVRNICITLLFCVLALIIYYFYVSEICIRKNIFWLTLITLASSYPLFTDYLIQGHDLQFHLTRIEGIAQGLQQGSFPVKIHPFWANDYGYAVGVFYGDALLYFPAILRNVGFSISEAYKIYVFFVNLATVLVSWKCFQRIFHSDRTGLLAAFLYTLAPYRLSNLYLRASVGEYTALIFLPLILCGFYLIFTEDHTRKDYWKNALLPSLGLTGIVQTHIISCEMVGIFLVIVCLIMIKKICNLKVFFTLFLAVILTVLLNLGFLIPFLSYFGGDYVMNSPEWYSTPIQSFGAYLSQLFPVFQNGTGNALTTDMGMAGEMPMGAGFALFLGLLFFLYLSFCTAQKKEKGVQRNFATLSCILTILALYMSTNLFPWNAIANMNRLFTKIVYNLQFPWRFLTISTLFLVVITCIAMQLAKKYFSKEKFLAAVTILICFSVISTSWFYYDILNRGDLYRPYAATDLNSMLLGSNEYLPAYTELSLLTAKEPVAGEGITVQSYKKNGTNIRLQLNNQSTAGFVELPLLYYKGYTAICGDTPLSVVKGTNNVVRLEIPEYFNGEISVFFQEPFLWRIGELISALSVMGIIIGLLITALRKRKHQIKSGNY